MPDENSLGNGNGADATNNPANTGADNLPGGAVPQVDNPPAPTGSVRSQIRQMNEELEEKLEGMNGDEPDEDIVVDDAAGDEPNEEDEPAGDDAAKADVPSEESFEFAPDADFETFELTKAAYLETVEITPELEAIHDRYEAEIANLRGAAVIGNDSPTITKTIEALGRIYETEVVDGDIKPNTKPLVEVLRTDYSNEFSDISRDILEADSTKYPGMSVFEERLVDDLNATPDKLKNILVYLNSDNASLPIPPPSVPKGVDAKLADAFREVGEPKRFEIESLVTEVARLETELKETTEEYYKDQIIASINEAKGKLGIELNMLSRIQTGINSERSQAETAQRQATEAAQNFERETWNAYNNEIFTISDNFAKDLAPKLSFVEGEAALAMSRNILARVNNALAFDVDSQMNLVPDPNADYFAKQLKEEGVQFEFDKGRELLLKHLKATRKVATLEHKRASPAAIENAKREKAAVLKDIKVEQQALLGQISAKYVSSSNKTLSTKVEKLNAAKQKTRAVISKSNGNVPQKTGNVRADIAAHNRRLAEKVKDGDDLFDYYDE